MKILITTSTLPATDTDPVPAFVKDQAIELNKHHPKTEITIHAPHNHYSQTRKKHLSTTSYREVRFHYFWPYRWELLAGRGILPALRQNKILYLQIPFLFTLQFFSLLKLVRKERPNVIYAHWFTPQAINAALVSKLTRTPFIFTTHASDVAVLRKLPLSKTLVAWVCRSASAYTAVSERTANKLASFFGPDEWERTFAPKLTILPMGVSTDLPKVQQEDIDKAKEAFKLPKNKQYVLFLGRLAEKKGVTYLIKAFSDLPSSLSKELHLIIAGDGQLKKFLEQQAKKLDLSNVTFTGYVHGTTKDALFAISDYACFPSIIDDSGDSEGFPVVLMESLAAGKIVLASNATGGEAILSDGVSGYIFTEKSASALQESLIKATRLTKSQKVSMQKAAIRLADQFNWPKITREHYRILEKVASEDTINK